MSGGSWDYFYRKVGDVALKLKLEKCVLRKAFGEHLLLVARALHDIEWVDSGDYGNGDELEAIENVLGDNFDEIVLSELKSEAKELIK